MTIYPREEVEAAFTAIVAAGDAGDWNLWSQLHTEDCVWEEHHYGTIVGREQIRSTITAVMAMVPMMSFPVAWSMIDGNRVVFYPWQMLPDPKGGDAVYRFGCVTILEYAGDGQFSRQEDIYNPNEATATFERWLADGGELPGDLPVTVPEGT